MDAAIEALEDRCLLAVAGPLLTYTAGPGEHNEVVISPGTPFQSIQDAPDVNQITAPPWVAADFLAGIGIDISFSVGFDVDAIPGDPGFDIGVGIGFPLYPFKLPEGVIGPPLVAPGLTRGDLVGNAVARATGGVASAVAGVPTTADGDVAYRVETKGPSLPGYRLYQAVVDPAFTVAETEPNDAVGTATTIDDRQIVTGEFGTATDRDVFVHTTAAFAGTRQYSVIVDNDPDKDMSLTGTKVTILSREAGSTAPPALGRGNVSFGDANAVGPVSITSSGAGLEVFVLVEQSGSGADNDYRFVLVENDPADQITETEPNDTQATATSLTAPEFGKGDVPSSLDLDFFSSTETTDGAGASTRAIMTGDLVFAYVDTKEDAADRRNNELDSLLTVFASDGSQIAQDDNDGPAMPAATFDEINSEIDNLIDFDSLLTVVPGIYTVTLLDGDDVLDIHKLGTGITVTADGGTGNDVIQTGGGATVTLSGGDGYDILEIVGTPGNDAINVVMSGTTLEVQVNGVVNSFPAIATATSGIEELGIAAGDGDDTITIDFRPGFTGLTGGISVGGADGISDEIRVIDRDNGSHVIFRQFTDDQTEGSFEFIGGDTVQFEGIEEWSIVPLDPVTNGLGGDGAGRVIVFDRDTNEFNDDRLNATLIGLDEVIAGVNVDLPADTNRPADEDWYRFVAPNIGTFSFQILYDRIAGLTDSGELNISVYNEAGTQIATGVDFTDGDVASFSSAADQVYFLRVVGADTDVVNRYDVTVVEVDKVGPQVFDPDGPGPLQAIQVTGSPQFNLFDVKPSSAPPVGGPTPLVNSVTINLRDILNKLNLLPADLAARAEPNGRAPGDLYPALDEIIAALPGHIEVRGDRTGLIPIQNIVVNNNAPVVDQIATATVEVIFNEPLPDDRFTLTIKDTLVDPPGNAFDGNSNAAQPNGNPTFPSGDGVAGGDFVARFTVDSRPELGAYGQQGVFVDANSSFIFDPPVVGSANLQDVSRDLAFLFGIETDQLFAGQFKPAGAGAVNGFDRLGAYGLVGGQFRFLLDFNDNGRIDVAGEAFVSNLQINGVPIAGNFDGNAANGDEIGLFNGQTWFLDTTGDNQLNAQINGNIRGLPIVGDFDDDGSVDFGTHIAQTDTFFFSLSTAGGGLASGASNVTNTFAFGFPGVLERPHAADMDQDGVDDIALTVPDQDGENGQLEWYILQSAGGGFPALVDPFSPEPLGNDIHTVYGDNSADGLLGNFDPPNNLSHTPTLVQIGATDDRTPTFEWDEVAGTWYYELQLYDVDLGQMVFVVSVQDSTSYTHHTQLAAGHNYSLYLRARNWLGEADVWAEPMFFSVNGEAFDPPTITGPAGTINDGTPNLTWTGNGQTYETVGYNTATGQQVAAAGGLTGGSHTLPALADGNYQFFLRAIRDGEVSNWSVVNFAVNGGGVQLPDRPLVTGPFRPDDATAPVFTWQPAANADEYEIWVFNVNTGQESLHVTGLTGTSYNHPQPLAAGVYRVFLRGINAAGAGNWGDAYDFEVIVAAVEQGEPPAVPAVDAANESGPVDDVTVVAVDTPVVATSRLHAPQELPPIEVDMPANEDSDLLNAVWTDWPSTTWWTEMEQPTEAIESVDNRVLLAGAAVGIGIARTERRRRSKLA